MAQPFRGIEGVHIAKTKLGEKKMQQVLDAIEQLVVQNNFAQLSIADICKEANIAVGTFYIYFDDKISAYSYLVHQLRKKIFTEINKAVANCTTREEKELKGITAFAKFAVKNPHCYNILWGCLSTDRQLFEDYYVSFAESYQKALQLDSDQLIDVDKETLAYVLMGITNFISLKCIFKGNITEQEIDQMIEKDIAPILHKGIFKKT